MNWFMRDAPDVRVSTDWGIAPLFKTGRLRSRLGDLVENLNETCHPESARVERYIGLEHLDPGSLQITRWGSVADGTTFTRRCRPGHVLFGKRRSYQRKVALVDFDAVVSGDIYVLASKSPDLRSELLPFLCRSERFLDFAVRTSAGSLSPRTSWSHLAQFEFLLPDLESQSSAANILRATEVLTQDQRTLAISTRAMLDSHSHEYFSREHADTESLGALIDRGLASLQTGPFGTMLAATSYVESGVPVVNPVNMSGEAFDLSNAPCVSPDEAERLSRFRIEPGDIVICRKRHVGRMVLATESDSGLVLGSDCIRLRIDPAAARSDFMLAFLRSPDVQKWLVRATSGSVMPTLSESSLRRLLVPLMTADQQRHFLARRQSLLELEAAAVRYSERLAAVTQGLTDTLFDGPDMPAAARADHV